MNIQCPLCVTYKNARRDLMEENWEKEGRIRGQNAEMINPNEKKKNWLFSLACGWGTSHIEESLAGIQI